MVTTDWLKGLVDFESSKAVVKERLSRINGADELVAFLRDYSSWNGSFANGVAGLVHRIGQERSLFREAGYPRAVADRSNLVASYFFDAIRDEYDDHVNPGRDTHRCMAQAQLIRTAELLGVAGDALDVEDSEQLDAINSWVAAGYMDAGGESQCTAERAAFFGMGYHLGSEVLADTEFSVLDEYMRAKWPDLVQSLMRSTMVLGGATHRCYAWVGVHSGHGAAVEADHFDKALEGVATAMRYLHPGSQEQLDAARASVAEGFRLFAFDHRRFFAMK